MGSKWPLYVAGGVLLFGGATLGTYLATKSDRQTAQQREAAQASQAYDSQIRSWQKKALEDAVRQLEERERLRQEAERKAQEAQERLKQFEASKNEVAAYVKSKIDSNKPEEAQAADYVLKLLGLVRRENFYPLDVRDSATQFFAHESALRIYAGRNVESLREIAQIIGKESLPDEAAIRAGVETWKRELDNTYGRHIAYLKDRARRAGNAGIGRITGFNPGKFKSGDGRVVPGAYIDLLCFDCLSNMPYRCDAHKESEHIGCEELHRRYYHGIGWSNPDLPHAPTGSIGYIEFGSNNLDDGKRAGFVWIFEPDPKIKRLLEVEATFSKIK